MKQIRSFSPAEPAGMKRWPLVSALAAAGLATVVLGGCSLLDSKSVYGNTDGSEVQIRSLPLVAQGSKTPEAYYALGKYYFYQGRMAQAKEAFWDALGLDQGHVDALNGLGVIYDREGKYDAARKLYEAALLKDPNAAHVWANLGYSLILAGKSGESVARLQKAVELDPSNEVARQHLAGVVALGMGPLASARTVQETEVAVSMPAAISSGPSPVASIVTAKGVVTVETKPVQIAALQTTVTFSEQVLSKPLQELPAPHVAVEAKQVNFQAVEPVSQSHPLIASVVRQTQPAAPGMDLKSAPVLGHSPATQVEKSIPKAVVIDQQSVRQAKAVPVTLRTEVTLTSKLGGVRIEVSNGNGVSGLAKAVSAGMSQTGLNVARITNAKPFNKPQTFIMCRPGLESVAAELARAMPAKPKIVLQDVAHRRVDVRVVLGADSALAWEDSSRRATLVASLGK